MKDRSRSIDRVREARGSIVKMGIPVNAKSRVYSEVLAAATQRVWMHRITLRFNLARLESDYLRRRQAELLPKTRKSLSFFIGLAMLTLLLHITAEPDIESDYLAVLIATPGVLIIFLLLLFRSRWVQDNMEKSSAVVCCLCVTMIVWAQAYHSPTTKSAEWDLQVNRSKANFWEVNKPYMEVESHARYHFVKAFSSWFVFSSVAVCVFSIRFGYTMLAVFPPMVLALSGTMPHLVALLGWHQVLFSLCTTYFPGLLVFILTPRSFEVSHRLNYVLILDKDKDLRARAETIKENNRRITDMVTQLAACQRLVHKVMSEEGTVLDQLEIPHSDISFDSSIGEGSFGTVYKATLRGDTEVAVKTLRVGKITDSVLRAFKHEIIIMCPLHHENVVRLHGGVWNEGADKLCIVLEFCARGSLTTCLAGNHDAPWVGVRHGLAVGAAKALWYLHEGLRDPLIHRDVKPDNILVSSDFVAKLGDFGESKHFQPRSRVRTMKNRQLLNDLDENSELSNEVDALSMTIAGTKLYCAPEVMSGLPYNASIDVFSFSLVLLGIALRDTEYVKNIRPISGAHLYCTGWRPPIPHDLQQGSRSLVELIRQCWSAEYHKRPKFGKIVKVLEEDCASLGEFDQHLSMVAAKNDSATVREPRETTDGGNWMLSLTGNSRIDQESIPGVVVDIEDNSNRGPRHTTPMSEPVEGGNGRLLDVLQTSAQHAVIAFKWKGFHRSSKEVIKEVMQQHSCEVV